eukprot:COSAG01_NODE_615_length_14818_cov_9.454039_3_plen_132_part_00
MVDSPLLLIKGTLSLIRMSEPLLLLIDPRRLPDQGDSEFPAVAQQQNSMDPAGSIRRTVPVCRSGRVLVLWAGSLCIEEGSPNRFSDETHLGAARGALRSDPALMSRIALMSEEAVLATTLLAAAVSCSVA